eukprot:jgi/Bigna1/67693/fgenesh1_pg.4_\
MKITYKDSEGDVVRVKSEWEMTHALVSTQKFTVVAVNQARASNSESASNEAMVPVDQNQRVLTTYFKPVDENKNKPGRPKKKRRKRSSKNAAANNVGDDATVVEVSNVETEMMRRCKTFKATRNNKATRKNWGYGKNLEILNKALESWDRKKKHMSAREFTRWHSTTPLVPDTERVPRGTLLQYVTGNRTIGRSVGKKPKIPISAKIALAHVVAMKDEASNGVGPKGVRKFINSIAPDEVGTHVHTACKKVVNLGRELGLIKGRMVTFGHVTLPHDGYYMASSALLWGRGLVFFKLTKKSTGLSVEPLSCLTILLLFANPTSPRRKLLPPDSIVSVSDC